MKKLFTTSITLAILGFMLLFQSINSNAQTITVAPENVFIDFDKVGDGPGKIDPPPPVELGTSETNAEENRFSFYPNPCQDWLVLEWSREMQSQQVIIFNLAGHKVYEATLTQEVSSIDLSPLKKGIYLIYTADSSYRLEKT